MRRVFLIRLSFLHEGMPAMKILSTIVVMLTLLTWASVCPADIIVDATAAADGDGVITCSSQWNTPSQTLTITGDQWLWDVGHIGCLPLDPAYGFLQADCVDDPTPTLRTIIDNDTGFSWTAYDVKIFMNKTFSFVSANVNYPATSELGWTANIVGSVSQVSPGLWMGEVLFTAGTPIPSGAGPEHDVDAGTLDFSYKVSFAGSAQFCQQMAPIPEPNTVVLAVGGLVGLLVVRRRFGR